MERLNLAINLACVFSVRKTTLLERSAASTLLLRRHGFDASLVIGVQVLPYESHAGVEIDGKVVSDDEKLPEVYRVLERC